MSNSWIMATGSDSSMKGRADYLSNMYKDFYTILHCTSRGAVVFIVRELNSNRELLVVDTRFNDDGFEYMPLIISEISLNGNFKKYYSPIRIIKMVPGIDPLYYSACIRHNDDEYAHNKNMKLLTDGVWITLSKRIGFLDGKFHNKFKVSKNKLIHKTIKGKKTYKTLFLADGVYYNISKDNLRLIEEVETNNG